MSKLKLNPSDPAIIDFAKRIEFALGLNLYSDSLDVIFFKNKKASEALLQNALSDPSIKVAHTTTQYSIATVDGARSVRLDICIEDINGVLYNVEVQRDPRGADPKRAVWNAVSLARTKFHNGQDFDEFPRST